MRRVSPLVWFLVLATLSACARPTAAARSGDTLVLEIGGGQGSLRQALVAAGAVVAAPKPREPAAEQAQVPAADDERVTPPPPVEPTAKHIVVELGRGETLIHLAKRYLGDGNRFREILDANGWTERDARRLPAGQAVKVPVDPANPPR